MQKKPGAQILVVEDDATILESVKELLESEGYRVATAREGAEALRWLRGTEALPDLIVLDLMMPGMNGVVFRQEQRQDAQLRNIPVLVMTADSQIASKTAQLGITRYVEKPLEIPTFLMEVQLACLRDCFGDSPTL